MGKSALTIQFIQVRGPEWGRRRRCQFSRLPQRSGKGGAQQNGQSGWSPFLFLRSWPRCWWVGGRLLGRCPRPVGRAQRARSGERLRRGLGGWDPSLLGSGGRNLELNLGSPLVWGEGGVSPGCWAPVFLGASFCSLGIRPFLCGLFAGPTGTPGWVELSALEAHSLPRRCCVARFFWAQHPPGAAFVSLASLALRSTAAGAHLELQAGCDESRDSPMPFNRFLQSPSGTQPPSLSFIIPFQLLLSRFDPFRPSVGIMADPTPYKYFHGAALCLNSIKYKALFRLISFIGSTARRLFVSAVICLS